MSRVNGEGGFVLTCTVRLSPARMLVWGQNPSIHGQRYLVAGSTPVLVSSQSRVPGRSFSRRIRSEGRVAAVPAGAREEDGAQPGRVSRLPAPSNPWRNARRFNGGTFTAQIFQNSSSRLPCIAAG